MTAALNPIAIVLQGMGFRPRDIALEGLLAIEEEQGAGQPQFFDYGGEIGSIGTKIWKRHKRRKREALAFALGKRYLL